MCLFFSYFIQWVVYPSSHFFIFVTMVTVGVSDSLVKHESTKKTLKKSMYNVTMRMSTNLKSNNYYSNFFKKSHYKRTETFDFY